MSGCHFETLQGQNAFWFVSKTREQCKPKVSWLDKQLKKTPVLKMIKCKQSHVLLLLITSYCYFSLCVIKYVFPYAGQRSGSTAIHPTCW